MTASRPFSESSPARLILMVAALCCQPATAANPKAPGAPSPQLVAAKHLLLLIDDLAKAARQQLEAHQALAAAARNGPQPTAGEIARVNPETRQRLDQISVLELRLQDLQSRRGADAEAMRGIESSLREQRRLLREQVDAFNARHFIAWKADRTGGRVIDTDAAAARKRLDELTTMRAAQSTTVANLERNRKPAPGARESLRARQDRLVVLLRAVRHAEAMLELARNDEPPFTDYAPEDVLRWDPRVLEAMLHRDDAQTRLRALQQIRGPDDPAVQEAAADVAKFDDEITWEASRFSRLYYLIPRPDGTELRLARTCLAARILTEELRSLCDAERDAIAKLRA